jgi:hypothetical protein
MTSIIAAKGSRRRPVLRGVGFDMPGNKKQIKKDNK